MCVAQVQSYVVCKLEDKVNILYSFIKTHLKAKVLDAALLPLLISLSYTPRSTYS